MSNKDFRSYLLGIESLCGKHLIDVPIALENENFKKAVQEHQSLEKLETILMDEFFLSPHPDLLNVLNK